MKSKLPQDSTTLPDASLQEDALLARLPLLGREASLRVAGFVCLFFGCLDLLWAYVSLSSMTDGGSHWSWYALNRSAPHLVFGTLAPVVGIGLMLLRPWVRWPAAIVGLVGLILLFPVASPMALYIGLLTFFE